MWFFYLSLHNTLSILVNHWNFIAFIFHEYFNIFFPHKIAFYSHGFQLLIPIDEQSNIFFDLFFVVPQKFTSKVYVLDIFNGFVVLFLLFRSFLENTRSIHTIIKRNCQYLGVIKCMLWFILVYLLWENMICLNIRLFATNMRLFKRIHFVRNHWISYLVPHDLSNYLRLFCNFILFYSFFSYHFILVDKMRWIPWTNFNGWDY